MKHYYNIVDYVQWVWKKSFNVEKSKAQIKRDLEQGAIKLNDKKLKVNDVIEIEDEKNKTI